MCFNTSHVVVYLMRTGGCVICNLFQYISCCSLSSTRLLICLSTSISIHLMLQFILPVCVTRNPALKFQYISCCSLSIQAGGCPVAADLFQYISCCSLSPPSYVSGSHQQGFNTSHVVVYRRLPAKSGTGNFSFNTSHVVVYLFPGCINICLFPFQYISCCSLSLFLVNPEVSISVSIHLMLQFIWFCSCWGIALLYVSIHLMLQFISELAEYYIQRFGFQYISCCSLS